MEREVLGREGVEKVGWTQIDPRVIQIFQYRNSSHSSLVFFKTKEFMPEDAISVLLYEQNKKPFT